MSGKGPQKDGEGSQDDSDQDHRTREDRSRSPLNSENNTKKGKKSTFNAKVTSLNEKVDKINNEIINKIETKNNDMMNKIEEINKKNTELNNKIDAIFNAINVMNNINNNKNIININKNNNSVEAKSSPTKRQASDLKSQPVKQQTKKLKSGSVPVNEVNGKTNKFAILDETMEEDIVNNDDNSAVYSPMDVNSEEAGTSGQAGPLKRKSKLQINQNGNDVDEFPPLPKIIKENAVSSGHVSRSIKNIVSNLDSNLNGNLNSNVNSIVNSGARSDTNSNINSGFDSNVINRDRVINKEPVKKINNKFPPITVYLLNQKLFRKALIDRGTCSYRVLSGANSNRSIVYAEDLDTYNNILELFKECNAHFYTFSAKEDKSINLILRGVPFEFNVDDLVDEFTQLKFIDRIDKITKLTEGKKEKFNYFILKLRKDESPGPFFDLKHMFNTRVSIVKFHRTDVVQCYNCQRPGHVADNCYMEFRCVRCSKNHVKGECPIPDEASRKELFCALCKTKGHPSSYRGCTYMQDIVKNKIRSHTQLNRHNPRRSEANNVDPTVRPNVSFADAARKAGGNQTNPNIKGKNKMVDLLDQESFSLFGCDYRTLDLKFTKFMDEYGSTKDSFDKKNILLNFIFETRYGQHKH